MLLGLFISVVMTSFLSVVSPTSFDIAFISAKPAQLDKEKKELDTIPNSSDSHRSYKKVKHKELQRKSAILKPSAPYLSVVGLFVDHKLSADIGFSLAT